MTTHKTIAKEAMREIKALSETGVIVINRADLEALINNAIESGIELGREYARTQAAKGKATKVGKGRGQSVPFDDEDDCLLMDDEDDDEPSCGACTKGDPPAGVEFDYCDKGDDREFREPYDDQ